MTRLMTVQNTLKAFIQERGISVYRFRQDIGVAQSTAYELVNNPDRIPNAEVLNKICQAYKIQPGTILGWIPDDSESAA
ncbi:MAG: helix-turn-helix transcriptional regulator [Phormidesmis sp. CAN_BIN44]|nr:helix-turn-helix transcriptional regulator [Phormidesmis sp. CAN_BIN44]